MRQSAVGFATGNIAAFRSGCFRTLLVAGACSALLIGCAGTPPAPKFTHDMVSNSRVAAADTAEVTIEAADNVNILPTERDRVAEKIKAYRAKGLINSGP